MAQMSKRLALPHTTLTWCRHSPATAKTAREARYALMHELAMKIGAQSIALGHTLDDQAETVVMRALRTDQYSDTRGLSGMSEFSTYHGVSLWRPLLGVRRQELREMLLAHPRMILDDPARVRFESFGVYSLDVEIFAYANTTDLLEFLAIKEDVLLRIMDIVSEAGTDLATPSQLTYLAQDAGLETDRSQEAEAQVEAWRDAGMLPFPEFAEDYRQKIENTLEYPPEGSPESGNPSGSDNET